MLLIAERDAQRLFELFEDARSLRWGSLRSHLDLIEQPPMELFCVICIGTPKSGPNQRSMVLMMGFSLPSAPLGIVRIIHVPVAFRPLSLLREIKLIDLISYGNTREQVAVPITSDRAVRSAHFMSNCDQPNAKRRKRQNRSRWRSRSSCRTRGTDPSAACPAAVPLN